MAAALTIRPLLTRLADVLAGRAGDGRGEAHLVASAPTVAVPTPRPGRSSSCPGGMDTSRCSGSVTIACRAIHFTGNVPSPLTASPAETSSRERRSRCSRALSSLGPGQRAARGFGYGFPRTAAGPAVLPAPGFRATGRSRPFPDSAGRYISEMSLDLGLPGAANPFQQEISLNRSRPGSVHQVYRSLSAARDGEGATVEPQERDPLRPWQVHSVPPPLSSVRRSRHRTAGQPVSGGRNVLRLRHALHQRIPGAGEDGRLVRRTSEKTSPGRRSRTSAFSPGASA